MLPGLRDAGVLEQMGRGLYRLSELAPLGATDLVAVARHVPAGVICLVSALAFHELSTQIPHAVHLALAAGQRLPRLDYPPIEVFRFRGTAFAEGVQRHMVDGEQVRIYGPEKTIADCFKLRHRIGLDVHWRRCVSIGHGGGRTSKRCCVTAAYAAWSG